MGTSSSFRAPRRPRWQAFVTALTSGQSIDRIRSELFNAGHEWEAELASPPIASFAQALVEAHETLTSRLASTDRPDVVLGELVREARDASLRIGFSPALHVAERAFAKLIIEAVSGSGERAIERGAQLVETWRTHRGKGPGDLLVRYLGELLAQYTRHAVDRETGRLATAKLPAQRVEDVAKTLSERAAQVGTAAAMGTRLREGVVAASEWERAVREAFEAGKSLPATE